MCRPSGGWDVWFRGCGSRAQASVSSANACVWGAFILNCFLTPSHVWACWLRCRMVLPGMPKNTEEVVLAQPGIPHNGGGGGSLMSSSWVGRQYLGSAEELFSFSGWRRSTPTYHYSTQPFSPILLLFRGLYLHSTSLYYIVAVLHIILIYAIIIAVVAWSREWI